MAELLTLARPYAKALYELASDRGMQHVWLKELALLADVSQTEQVQRLFQSPTITWHDKLNDFVYLFEKEDLHPLIQHFLAVLASNQRLSLLPSIYDKYQKMVLADEQVEDAVIYTAYPLSEEELASIVDLLEKRYHLKLQAKLVVDRELIGGIKVEFDDQVLDMSVKSRLALLQQKMIN